MSEQDQKIKPAKAHFALIKQEMGKGKVLNQMKRHDDNYNVQNTGFFRENQLTDRCNDFKSEDHTRYHQKQKCKPEVNQISPEKKVDGCQKHTGQDRREDKSHRVLRQLMVDSMDKEMERDRPVIELNCLVEVEKKAVQGVLDEGPEKDAADKGKSGTRNRHAQLCARIQSKVCEYGSHKNTPNKNRRNFIQRVTTGQARGY